MIEITLHGRGGQGGVTLAKLIATAFFLRGKWTQAFGIYAAERSGAPVQAYVRIDDAEITNHNQIREPNHLIVLDAALIGTQMLSGLDPSGWIIVNAPAVKPEWLQQWTGRHVATIDASAIAVKHGLGTAAVPIVNTTMMGAVARALDLGFDEVRAAMAELKLSGANLVAAQEAYEQVTFTIAPGTPHLAALNTPPPRIAGLLDPDIGGFPVIRTGTWATRTPRQLDHIPPCITACPAGNDVQGFIAAASRGAMDDALNILLRTSPLPGVCGRVCPAPCMTSCNRNELDSAVNVRDLERYVAGTGWRPDPVQPWRKQRLAVVGSGPAGLSASYQLARLGYNVTLLEAADELGGVLRNGIPDYRLPKDVLDQEIGYILDHGLTVFMNERVDRATLQRLSEKFDGVVVATGLQVSRSLDLGSTDGVLQGISFLDRVHRGDVDTRGQRVVVIGGGNTAIDAARSALRLGAESVEILYRRTRTEMPAIAAEIEAALEEGIGLHELVLPVHMQRGSVTCVRMTLGEPDDSGRRKPVPDESSRFMVPADLVILAIGQEADYSIVGGIEAIRDNSHLLFGAGGAPVILCGDLAGNEGTVAAAIGTGSRSALLIHHTLCGEEARPVEKPRATTPPAIRLHSFSPLLGWHGDALPPALRKRVFAEVHSGLSGGAAVMEARRCFSCGVCSSCDLCLEHCPEGTVTLQQGGYRFDYDYCKGCGICEAVCPRGVIEMS